MSKQELFNSVGAVQLNEEEKGRVWYFGWIPMHAHIDAHVRNRQLKFFAESSENLTGTRAGKTVLLYEAVRQVWKRDLDTGPQLRGDCVGWGFAGCIDLIACPEVTAGEAEQHSWELRTSTEAVYALSRVEYGNYDGSSNDGSFGVGGGGGSTGRHRFPPNFSRTVC